MKIKLLLLTLFFFTKFSFAQNYVIYSSKSGTVTTNSGVEGSIDIIISCYGNSSNPVILNQHFLCGDPDGFVSNLASNGLSLIPGQTTTLKFKFKKTVTSDTQKVYKFTTNGSCFQNDSEMIKITVNYKSESTTNPTNPTNPTDPTPEWSKVVKDQTINEGGSAELLVGGDAKENFKKYDSVLYQWKSSTTSTVDYQMMPIVGATSKDYNPGILNVTTYFKRDVIVKVNNNGVSGGDGVKPSNTITITVIPSPPIKNNTIELIDWTIKGSIPTGGLNFYTYSWVLWGADDPYTFPDTGQNLEITETLYNYLSSYPNATIVRYVTSGSRGSASNHVNILPVPLPITDIQNNTISISGYKITGSQPTGGVGEYKYSWFLGSQEDPIIFDETTKDLDLTPYPFAISLLQNDHTAIIFRTVRSVKRSNSNKISLYGTSALKQQTLNIQSESDLLTVFPNPTSESVNFSTNFSTNKEIEIIVYSEKLRNEKSIFKGTVTPNQVVNWNIPSSYQRGLYFYKILSGSKEVKTGKIIVQ